MPPYVSPTSMGVAPIIQSYSGGYQRPAATSPAVGTQTGGPFSAGAPPDLAALTDLVNKLNLTAQQASNAGRIPGNPALEQKSSSNIGSLLAGQIPADILTNLSQAAAERGVSIGSPGSDNANSSFLRSLGLTGLDLQQKGQQDLSAADARNPGAPIFDPTTQILTPYQAGQLGLGQGQQNIEWWKALHPNMGGGGGGYGGGGGQPSSGGGGQDMSWFGRLLNQVMAGQNPATTQTASSSAGGSSVLYPGSSVPGLPDLGSILGPQDPGYAYSPNPAGQTPLPDYSDPNTWDFTGGYG